MRRQSAPQIGKTVYFGDCDDSIARARIEVIVTFNSVTREYLLNYRRDRKLVRSETFTDFATLVTRMTNIEERDLFEIGNRQYFKLKVRVKADLMRGWLLYVVPWEISTSLDRAAIRARSRLLQPENSCT